MELRGELSTGNYDALAGCWCDRSSRGWGANFQRPSPDDGKPKIRRRITRTTFFTSSYRDVVVFLFIPEQVLEKGELNCEFMCIFSSWEWNILETLTQFLVRRRRSTGCCKPVMHGSRCFSLMQSGSNICEETTQYWKRSNWSFCFLRIIFEDHIISRFVIYKSWNYVVFQNDSWWEAERNDKNTTDVIWWMLMNRSSKFVMHLRKILIPLKIATMPHSTNAKKYEILLLQCLLTKLTLPSHSTFDPILSLLITWS